MPRVCPNPVDKREFVMPGLTVTRRKVLGPSFPDHGPRGLDIGRCRGNVLIRDIELFLKLRSTQDR